MFSTNKIYSGQFFRECLSFAVREQNLKVSSALKKMNTLTSIAKVAFVSLQEKQENDINYVQGHKKKKIIEHNIENVDAFKGFFWGGMEG